MKKIGVMTTISSPELEAAAKDLGVRIISHTGGRRGYYDEKTRTISLRADLEGRYYRCTLAHELAHAMFGHDRCNEAHYERKADEWAAGILISASAYQFEETVHGPNHSLIAYELDVTEHMLSVWLDIVQRKGLLPVV